MQAGNRPVNINRQGRLRFEHQRALDVHACGDVAVNARSYLHAHSLGYKV